ncbi:MAG: hypothetical protein L0154_11105 [Chloroflexi bacterium]|nr:hypothetical protein [Chloroflexota bacterium]
MTSDVERLDENAQDMKFLIYCLLVVMLLPLGFLSIITYSDKLSPGDYEEVVEEEPAPVDELEEEVEAEEDAPFQVGWTIIDIDTFA